MNSKTKEMIIMYYNNIISSQKLIQYLKTNTELSNEEIFCEYHGIDNVCKNCGKILKYSGFKNGFRCTKECSYERKIKVIIKEPLTKELIIKNITKQGNISRKFLKEYNVTEKYCYEITHEIKKCKYCNNKRKFINYCTGTKEICSSIKCKKQQRKERTIKTNNKRYGVDNVSQLKEIQELKPQTLFKNYGVYNISSLDSVQKAIRKTNEASGRWLPYNQLTDKKDYELKVRRLSEKQNIQSLENYGLRGSVEKDGFHLDHIYSVSDGFKNNIPVYIIGNINNLRFIPAKENQSKNSRSDISLAELINKVS